MMAMLIAMYIGMATLALLWNHNPVDWLWRTLV